MLWLIIVVWHIITVFVIIHCCWCCCLLLLLLLLFCCWMFCAEGTATVASALCEMGLWLSLSQSAQWGHPVSPRKTHKDTQLSSRFRTNDFRLVIVAYYRFVSFVCCCWDIHFWFFRGMTMFAHWLVCRGDIVVVLLLLNIWSYLCCCCCCGMALSRIHHNWLSSCFVISLYIIIITRTRFSSAFDCH